MSQKIRAHSYLKNVGPLTSLIALTELGIMDLPKRMSELKADGVPFEKSWLKIVNRFGEKTRIRTYYIKIRS